MTRFFPILFAVFASCSSAKVTEVAVAPLPETEIQRARLACETYVSRVCACAVATKDAALVRECEFSKARPEALELNIELATSTGLSSKEMQVVKAEVRKISNGCFTADGRLNATTCPRLPK